MATSSAWHQATIYPRQRCLIGTLATLVILSLLCSVWLFFHAIIVQKPVYEFYNFVSGKGWSWNPLEYVATTPDGRSVKKVKDILPGGLLDAFSLLASSHLKKSKLVDDQRWSCPSMEVELGDESIGVDGESLVGEDRYAERNAEGFCDSSAGMWNSKKAAPVIRYKYEVVAELMGLRHGHRVLDWGAGCGHALDLIAGEHRFEAVAIDIEKSNVEWGHENLHHLRAFCAMDGARLSFPDRSFDAIVSNAAFDHIAEQTEQCNIIKTQVLRVLRPGGCAWFGYMGAKVLPSKGNTPQDFWTNGGCQLGVGIGLYSFSEHELFGTSEYDDQEAYSLFVCSSEDYGYDRVPFEKVALNRWQEIPHNVEDFDDEHTRNGQDKQIVPQIPNAAKAEPSMHALHGNQSVVKPNSHEQRAKHVKRMVRKALGAR